MAATQRRLSCSPTFLIVGLLGLAGTGVGAEPNPEALPNGAAARFGWSPLHIGYGAAFAFTADGRTVVAVTPYGELRRFDAQTGRLLERHQLSDRSDVNLLSDCSVQLSADGQTLAIYESGFTGPRVTVYDVASGKKIFRRESGKSLLLFGRLSPNGKQLAVVEWPHTGYERNLRLIDLKTGRLSEIGTYGREQIGIYFSSDGKRLLVSEPDPVPKGSWNRPHTSTIDFFDLTFGKKIWRRSAWGTNFAISRDGRIIVSSGYKDQALEETGFHVLRMNGAWDKPTEQFFRCFGEIKGGMREPLPFTTLLLAPDDRTIVTQYFGEVYLWDLQDRKEIRHFLMSKEVKDNRDSLPMAVSADSRRMLTNVKYLQCWDLKTGKPAFTPPDDSLPDYLIQLAFAPDGRELFASTNNGLSKWSLAAGQRLDVMRDRSMYESLIFRTLDGIRAVKNDYRGRCYTFTLSDPAAGKLLHTIRSNTMSGHYPGYVEAVSLTANGKVLLAVIENLLSELAPPSLELPLSGGRPRTLLQSWAEQTQDVHLAIEARLALERLGPAHTK